MVTISRSGFTCWSYTTSYIEHRQGKHANDRRPSLLVVQTIYHVPHHLTEHVPINDCADLWVIVIKQESLLAT